MKKKKDENTKALRKSNNKEKVGSKFIKFIKQKWLINGTTTLLLIAILIAAFILLNIGVKKLNLTSLDCTEFKNYTLTDESKNRIKDIDKDVKIYLAGFSENDGAYELLKQYNKVNNKIVLETVDLNENKDFANKYKITAGVHAIIVESGNINKVISESDLSTYDESGNIIDLTEQKVTSAIVNTTINSNAKMYVLTGYTDITTEQSSKSIYLLLNQYVADEAVTYSTLDLLSAKKVPDDCNTLVILNPNKDFDKNVSDEIIKYIKNGGNILWLNGAKLDDKKLDNVNRVLAEYGINPFEKGVVYETDKNNIVGFSSCFKPAIQSTEITNEIVNKNGILFLDPTKINIDNDKLEKLNVTKTDLILSSETAYFTNDLTGESSKKSDTKGAFVQGVLMKKALGDKKDNDSEDVEKQSELILIADDYFISDTSLVEGMYPMIYQGNNADLFLNSVAYLADQNEDITLRKGYSEKETTLTATDGQISIIMKIIFIVPIAIIALGIIIWIIRKNKK